ncbi:siderophore ferric iron reductase [Agarivorans aestuarii]|uniref:Siderophore ferric iron reductase n=1 Tax=Agarivorans aestuarii TaxID=1563703 RepID=A0ABU7G0Q5_9ALTE|nr:siderophore ferric iron reductase [Agarivorans aestuarii]MEE1672997.1 siderophore ferric iron reductase [Agarivorans aestuarii]
MTVDNDIKYNQLLQQFAVAAFEFLSPVESAEQWVSKGTSQSFEQLYQFWQLQHPEAGKIYWQSRSWSMLAWQPISLALIAYYQVQASPDFSRLKQRYHLGNVFGYQFEHSEKALWQQFDTPSLLRKSIAQSLRRVLDQLLEDFSQVTRISPSTAYRNISDGLLDMMLRGAKASSQSIQIEQLEHEFAHWVEDLGLPLQPRAHLFEDTADELQVARVSCCMDYKKQQGRYCVGCPCEPNQKQNKKTCIS